MTAATAVEAVVLAVLIIVFGRSGVG